MNAAAATRWLPVHYLQPGLYAGFWRRVVAWFIDAVILAAVLAPLGVLLPVSTVPWTFVGGGQLYGGVFARFGDERLQTLGLLLWWLYCAGCESSRWQATPGKLALGLAVTDEVGRRIGLGRATGRCLGMFLSGMILCVGYLMAGWTPRRQALHDLIAGCCVVRRSGLARWERIAATSAPAPAATFASPAAMPAWAIALVVLACVVLALPGVVVLGALALPAYRGYTVRTEVAQGLDASLRARALIAEYIGERGRLPVDNGVLGLPEPEAIRARYVSSVRVVEGKVVVTYGNGANPWLRGHHVVMSPIGNAAMLRWQCSSPDIRPDYLPQDCRP